MKLQELRRFTKIMKSYERTQVLYFCVEVINVRIEVVYNVTSMRYVNKCRIFVKEVLLTQTAPHSCWPKGHRMAGIFWPTAVKLGCMTNFDMLFLMTGFISLVNEIQLIITSHYFCIKAW